MAALQEVARSTFGPFNAGVGLVVFGLLLDAAAPARFGSALLAVAGVTYAIGAGRTLWFTVRDPRRAWSPLSVLP